MISGIVLIAASLAGPVAGTARERLSIFAVGAFSFVYGIWVATQTSGFFMFSVAPAGMAVMIIVRAVQHAGQKKPAAAPSGAGAVALSAGTPAEAVPAGAAAAAAAHRAPYTSAPPPPAPSWPEAPSRHGPAPRHEASPGLEAPHHTEGAGARHGRRTALSALQAAQPEQVRQAVHGTSRRFCPAFQLPGSSELSAPGGGLDYYLSESLAFGWSLVDGKPRLPRGEELFGLWQASARVKVAVGRDLNPTTPRAGVSWVTVLDGTGLIALTRHRVIGVVVRGDSLLGAFDGAGGTGIALWSLPLRRFSSASVTAVGHGEGLILSSAEPAGHVTLTGIGTADVLGRQAAAVPPGHVADMINRARAAVSSRIG
ncbi:MAG: hypothetical protein ACRDOH_15915 [Streptosporangiaceae bacterium]